MTFEGIEETVTTKLEWIEKRNLALLVLSYAFLMSSISIIVGTAPVVVLSLEKEGSDYTDISTLSFALFILGTAFISLFTTPIFRRGRKIGFIIGNIFGIVGAILGAVAVRFQSLPILMISYVPLGAANGIGNYLRFAAVEIMPQDFKALAVTLVLSGGIISAFLGPESVQGTKFIFPDIPFLNIFVVLAIFNAIMFVLVCSVQFPSKDSKIQESGNAMTASSSSEKKVERNEATYLSLVMSHEFWIPALLASLSWGIMGMPMSITRVAMADTGYISRTSLTVIEVHFLGMFTPGFVAGKIMKRKGHMFTLAIAVSLFIVALLFNLTCGTNEEGTGAMWFLGLFFIGSGWNFGFASSTVWLTQLYGGSPHLKAKIQASNDFIMFGVSGLMIFSTGYIYDSRESTTAKDALRNWRIVNYVVLCYVGLFGLIFLSGYWLDVKKEEQPGVKIIDVPLGAEENAPNTSVPSQQ